MFVPNQYMHTVILIIYTVFNMIIIFTLKGPCHGISKRTGIFRGVVFACRCKQCDGS